MADPDPKPESPGTYHLSDDPPPRGRYVRQPGFRASSERDPDEFDQPVLKRFFGTDPFPWALAVCVLLWVGLGSGTRVFAPFGLLLFFAGLIVCVLSQVWLYLSIFMDDREAGILSLISGWYRLFYLYANPELAWRPAALAAVGLAMSITGLATFGAHMRD